MANNYIDLPVEGGGGGSGTVTSVGLADATGLFTVSGSPVTTAGVLTLASFNTKSANTVFAGPITGAAAPPTFRSLVAADLPAGGYDSTYFKQNGNSFGASAVLGTNDSNSLTLRTNSSTALTIDISQNLTVNNNIFMSNATLPIVGYITTNHKMLVGGFTGSAVVGSFLQLFGNANGGSGATPSGGAELVLDSSNGATKFNIINFNGAGFINSFTVTSDGFVGVLISAPTAIVNIAAGSHFAGTAPLKLTASSSILSTPEDGAFEYDGTHLYFTIGATRMTII